MHQAPGARCGTSGLWGCLAGQVKQGWEKRQRPPIGREAEGSCCSLGTGFLVSKPCVTTGGTHIKCFIAKGLCDFLRQNKFLKMHSCLSSVCVPAGCDDPVWLWAAARGVEMAGMPCNTQLVTHQGAAWLRGHVLSAGQRRGGGRSNTRTAWAGAWG